MRPILLLGTALALAAALGCTRANPAYCTPAALDACQPGFRCDPELNVCVAAGEPLDAGHEAGGDARGDASTDGGADARPECTQSSECTDPAKPICKGDVCQPCAGDNDCLGRDPAAPACDVGRCYECSTFQHCTAAGKPLCGGDHSCGPCRRDLECKNGPEPAVGVCVAGDCPDPDSVLWADAAGLNCGAADGSPAKPFCTLTDAKAAAKAGARKTIVARPGTYGFVAFKEIQLNGLVVVGYLDGQGGEAVIQGDASHPAVDIDLVGAVTLRRLHLKGALGTAVAVLQCSGAACTGEELEIDQGGIGVNANAAAPLTLARCRVHNNQAGGVTAQNFSSFVVVNNFIYANGSPTSLVGGVLFDSSYQTKQLVNNTIAKNRSAAGVGAGVHCDAADILVSNNILWDNRDTAVAEVNLSGGNPVCVVTYSVIDDTAIAQLAGAHNTAGDPLFVNVLAPPYNLHLQDLSSALGGGDPTVAPGDDIDGQTRPAGGPIDIGADQKQ